MVQVKLAAGIEALEIHVTLAQSPSLIFGAFAFIYGMSFGNTAKQKILGYI